MTEVTVLTSTYNGASFLPAAIESVLAQSLSDWRMVVVDDGSTDGSADLVERYDDPRIRVIRQSNAGQTAALNRGLAEVETRWVARLDQDDVCLPTRLERQLNHLRDRPGTVLIGSWTDIIDEHDRPVGRFRYPTEAAEVRRALWRAPLPIAHSAACYSTDVARRVGGYPTGFSYAQDYAMWSRMAEHGEIANLAEVLVHLRSHSEQTSLDPAVTIRQIDEALTVIDDVQRRFGLVGPDRRAWRAGRLRLVTQRAIALAKRREARPLAADLGRIAMGALTTPGVLGDLAEVGRAHVRESRRRAS
jgi:GT2 family glycosyltransferase